MANKALYILAGYDETTDALLSDIQSKLYDRGFTGTHTKNIPQHITLGSFPTDQEDELTEFLHTLSNEVRSFDVTFNHVGIFGGSKVLFIAPDCNEQLLKLKEHFGSAFNWTPHTTMLIDEPDVICRALPTVMQHFSSFKGIVTTLHLYEFFPARHILSIPLKAE